MCGLLGMFVPTGVSPPNANLDAMMTAIRHRGPDGRGTFISPDRRFQGGFVRLAIIDLETGDQPLVDSRGLGQTVLLGNGEIYNYLELRDALAAAGHVFHTRGDMEVALRAFQARGLDFVEDLNGMYGLALWQARPHRLVLVRDRLGIKQVYWAKLPGGGLIFASEPKALLASGLIAARVDQNAVAAYLLHGYVPAPATLYEGINKLPPGCRLIAEGDGTIQVESYWRPRPVVPRDGADWSGHLTGLLADSVRLQLRSDVPVGALLSGGIDSGLVVALAAEAAVTPLATFTVRFDGAPYDETPLAALVAQRYGTRHHEFTVSSDQIVEHLPSLAWHCDEPLNDASLLPNFLIEQMVGQRVKVCLNGTGGDELFAGYGRHLRMPVEARWLRLPRPLRGLAAAMASPMTAWRLRRAELFDRDRGLYLSAHTTYFPPPMKKMLGCRLNFPAPVQQALCAAYPGPADTAQLAAEMESYLPEDLLLLLDRTSMAWAVEGRVPFLDHRLVEAALAVPPHIRTEGGRQKALLRQMAQPYLPEDILEAPKRGFASPVPHWFKGPLGPLARQLLAGPRALARGWWSAEGIRRLLADPDRHGHRLYALIMLELVIRLHVEGGDPTLPLEELVHG